MAKTGLGFKLKNKGLKVGREIGLKTSGYIAAAFGLVAALAWNEAIKTIIDELVPIDQSTIWAKLIYALLVSVLAVLAMIYLVHDQSSRD